MSPNGEPSAAGAGDYGERLSLESSVLRTLCLTVNATGSEVKYKIIDTLSEDDFFFPVNKSIFTALSEMHRRGDYVVYTNLEEELRHQSVDIPEDLYIEDFFQGKIPELAEVGRWVTRLKEWSRKPLSTTGPASAPAPTAAPTAAPTPSSKDSSSKVLGSAASSPEVNVTRVRANAEVQKRSTTAERTSKPVFAKREASSARLTKAAPKPVLSSEGDEWGEYLNDLASQQGKSFDTGFKGLDEDAGGITTGVMLFVDQEPERRSSFLKQLTDQIAVNTQVPCLFLSFEAPKTTLRIRTLSRLSGVPAKDIEKGRLKKDSPEWESVERNGRKAAGWLKRVFVVEATQGMSLDSVRDLARRLVEGTDDATGLVVIDNLDELKQADSGRAIVSELRKLSDDLNVLVVAATVNRKLLADGEADFSAQMAGGETGVRLEFTPAGESETLTVRFKYQPTIHKFTEQ